MPAAAAGERRALIGLGVLLGLTYLTRFEAIWLGLTFAGLVLAPPRAPPTAGAPPSRDRGGRCDRRRCCRSVVAAQPIGIQPGFPASSPTTPS